MEIVDFTLKALIISIGVFGTFYLILKFLIIPNYTKLRRMDFVDALGILQSIIKTELDLYQNDVIRSRTTITNANFENYLVDIVRRISENISDELYTQLEFYVTRTMINSLIVRSVKDFLLKKINGSIE